MPVSSNIPKQEIFIRYPTGERRRFSVLVRSGRGTSEQKTETLKHPGIDSTNRLYLTGKISREEAYEALKHLADAIKGKPAKKKPEFLPANKKILDQYWKKVYGPREIKDRQSAYNRLLRAVKALGMLPLSTAADTAIFEQLREAQPNISKRKALIVSLQQLIRFIGRSDIQVPRIKKQRKRMQYLSLEEFKKVLPFIDDGHFKLLAGAFFATGCRPGELFLMRREDFNEKRGVAFVQGQIERDTLKESDTKTGRQRNVAVLPECAEYLKAWLELGDQARMDLRKARHSEIFRKALRKAFPGSNEKAKFVFYHLRHSYAVHALNRGVPVELVAQSLGNSITVCQDHYLGSVLSEGAIDTMTRLLRG